MSASVAQGIEQLFPVPCVGGSNPSRRGDVEQPDNLLSGCLCMMKQRSWDP